jgi:tRNA threonylcarbamoyladenosine biosynthesis protein TsaB
MGITLSLETSAKAASVALTSVNELTHDNRLLAQYFQNSGLTHSRTVLKMVEDILLNNDVSVRDLDCVAVAIGPGSFTGIRIGIAAAQGIAWGAEKPVRGVSTLRAMASPFENENVVLCPVMDARRGEVYTATFEFRGGKTERTSPDRAIPVAQLIEESQKSTAPYLLIGDGAEMCYEEFIKANARVSLAPAATRLQTAYGVALAAQDVAPTSPENLVPNYLRVSQAERLKTQQLP